jgi:tight adherence protein B
MLPTPVLVTFVLVIGIIGAAYYFLVLKPEEDEHRDLRRRLKTKNPLSRAAAGDPGLLRTEAPLSQIPFVNTILGATGLITRPLQRAVDRSGLNLTVGALVLMCLCTAVAVFLLVQTFTRLALAAAVMGAASAYIPIWFVNFKGRSRIAKFEEQFPEAIDLIARALRAGHALPTGLGMVADEIPAPVGTEFRILYDEQNFGLTLPDAVRNFAARIPVLDARFFATAVLTQRETGGNLAEVLDNLASVIRERFKVKRQVRVISAHGRITGWVLACLPPCVAIAAFVISPTHIQTLTGDPLGIQMLIGAGVMQVLGTLVIRKIVDIEY